MAAPRDGTADALGVDQHRRDARARSAHTEEHSRLPARAVAAIGLADPKGALAGGSEAGNVTAIEYRLNEVPDDEFLLADMRSMLAMLGRLYGAEEPDVAQHLWLFQGNPKRGPEMLEW